MSPTLNVNLALFAHPCKKKLGIIKKQYYNNYQFTKWFSSKFQLSMTIFHYIVNAKYTKLCFSHWHLNKVNINWNDNTWLMLKFLSSMLYTSKTHPFSLGNYLGTSLIIRNLMIIRVTSVEWTCLGLEWPPA